MAMEVFMPVRVDGRVSMVRLAADADALERFRAEENQRRVQGIVKRRLYVDGRQYEDENDAARAEYCKNGATRLPEHLRVHAYSTQIQECIKFLANRIGEGFVVEAEDAAVQAEIEKVIGASDQFWTYDEDGNQRTDTTPALFDALVAGDVAVHVQWDEALQHCYLELWEAENVQFIMRDTRQLEAVERTEMVWRMGETGERRQVAEICRWEYAVGPTGQRDVRYTVQWEDEKEPHEDRLLGLGVIPWGLLRAERDGLREFRGKSLITEQAMETADRFNAVEQTGYLIARYNSHANVAVIGDAATLKVESEGKVHKDVADVLTFPGGTQLQVLSLPTDPQMIEHQRSVLSEALHAQFGVVRLEPDSLKGMGAMSGYALEILNEKSQATFGAVVRQWRKDWAALWNLILDVTAYKREAEIEAIDAEGNVVDLDDESVLVGDVLVTAKWWEVDPRTVFPNRKVRIRMGSGYIVDEVRVRDDFVSGLISREQALRERGYGDQEISKIVGEIDAERAKEQGPSFGEFTEWSGTGRQNGAGSTVAGSTAR
jgi:hypothetical protein